MRLQAVQSDNGYRHVRLDVAFIPQRDWRRARKERSDWPRESHLRREPEVRRAAVGWAVSGLWEGAAVLWSKVSWLVTRTGPLSYTQHTVVDSINW